jgi:hypothetical protein
MDKTSSGVREFAGVVAEISCLGEGTGVRGAGCFPGDTRPAGDISICGLCGNKIKQENNLEGINEVEIVHKEGEAFSGFADWEETRFHICGKCFDEKLIPWMKENGAIPQTDHKWGY